MKRITKKDKLFISSIIFLLLAIIGVSYAYYVARINGSESSTTIDAESSKIEVTYTDGNSAISASDLAPGWSASKTFTVKNTGSVSTVYYLKIFDVSNTLVGGGLKYKITSTNGGTSINKTNVPTSNSIISNSVSINKNITHSYTINVYYEDLEIDQTSDLGKSFSFKVGISGTNTL